MLDHYRLLKFTYGLTTSPFLAVQVLKQLAEHSAESYPDAYAFFLVPPAYAKIILWGF